MKTTQHTCLYAMLIAGIAAVLLTVSGPKDDAAAQEAKKETQTPDSAKTRDDSVKTRTASCNCGQLCVTVKGPDPERISLCHCNLCQKQSGSALASK